jgi:hypothetical protein
LPTVAITADSALLHARRAVQGLAHEEQEQSLKASA